MDVKKIIEMGPYEETFCDTRKDPAGCRFVGFILYWLGVAIGLIVTVLICVWLVDDVIVPLFIRLKKRKRLNDVKVKIQKKDDDWIKKKVDDWIKKKDDDWIKL